MANELQQFVRECLARGVPRDAVRAQLHAAGWRAEEVDDALAEWVDADFPVPVPRRRPYTSAREAFLYLVLFATLYLSAYNTGALLFAMIERALPDPAWRMSGQGYRAETARAAAAALLIAFPIFLWLSRVIGRAIEREPRQRGSRVRKWLTWLTLFVAALVLIGDLIFLVTRLLAGELIPRVLLKCAVVFAIAGTVFGHYLADLRGDEAEGAKARPRRRLWPRLAAAAVLATLVAGLVLSGSPTRERSRQFDAERIGNLQAIATAIESYARENRVVPERLDQLVEGPAGHGVAPVQLEDPARREAYEYRALDSLSYELCASFDDADSLAGDPYAPRARGVTRFWSHPAGRHCFTVRVPRRALERP